MPNSWKGGSSFLMAPVHFEISYTARLIVGFSYSMMVITQSAPINGSLRVFTVSSLNVSDGTGIGVQLHVVTASNGQDISRRFAEHGFIWPLLTSPRKAR